MKLIDERGRLFGKVSLIDILVILFALVMALAVYLRFFANETTSIRSEGDTFSYTVKVEGVRHWTADGFHVGDKMWDSDHDTYIGTITSVSSEPSTYETKLADGTYKVAPRDGRYDVYLTVEAEGLISNGRYYASRTYEVGANSGIYFYTKYCSVAATVWSMN
ncbi:MAG: DUF4330 domain-containing protein [Oscillospiraceae bacterium]|nr:DUF4330 domain-containing protein [Oscillospiraceae bacterium]